MKTFDFSYSDNLSKNPELCFDMHGHVISIPTLDISLPSLLKAAEKDFYKNLTIENRKSFRLFCRSMENAVPSLMGKNILLPFVVKNPFIGILGVYKDETILARFIRDPWDIYDPSLPVFRELSDIVRQFCRECTILDSQLVLSPSASALSTDSLSLLSDMLPGYIAETLENARTNGERLCDIRKLTHWMLSKVRENPLYAHNEISLFDPMATGNSNTPELLIPLHLSGWMYVFLLLTHMMTALSIDSKVIVSLLHYEDRVDFRWETATNLSAKHFRNDNSFASLVNAVPSLRVPAEFLQVLCHRHGFIAELLDVRSILTCTVTVYTFTEHLLDFKFNDPMGRAEIYYPETDALIRSLKDFSAHQAEEAIKE